MSKASGSLWPDSRMAHSKWSIFRLANGRKAFLVLRKHRASPMFLPSIKCSSPVEMTGCSVYSAATRSTCWTRSSWIWDPTVSRTIPIADFSMWDTAVRMPARTMAKSGLSTPTRINMLATSKWRRTLRNFCGTRPPPRMIVMDSQTGKEIANLPTVEGMDGVYFDPRLKRIYISGGRDFDVGYIFAYQQKDADHYETIGKIPTKSGAGTSFWSPELNRYYVAAPAEENEGAAILVFEPKP